MAVPELLMTELSICHRLESCAAVYLTHNVVLVVVQIHVVHKLSKQQKPPFRFFAILFLVVFSLFYPCQKEKLKAPEGALLCDDDLLFAAERSQRTLLLY